MDDRHTESELDATARSGGCGGGGPTPFDPLRGTPPPALEDARVGQVLRGRWRIVRRIGDGGTAEVYEVRHRNGRRGAVKLLRPELLRFREAKDRLLYEGKLANLVKHPGIVEALDDDVAEDGTPFLVMELLEGEALDEKLATCADDRMSVEDTCRLGIALLEALEAVHAAGVLHRDLKPDNIFITNDGCLKLLDFGIARAEDAPGTHKARLGVAMGTPGYMPMEQAVGDWENVDQRTDVWAAGAVLHRVLTGSAVFEESSLADTMSAAMTRGALPIAHTLAGVPAALADVIDKALRVHPSDRWQSATEMLEALRAAQTAIETEQDAQLDAWSQQWELESLTPSASSTSEIHRPRARRGLAWVSAVMMACAGILVAGFAGSKIGFAQGPSPAVASAAARTSMAPLDIDERGDSEGPVRAASGAAIAAAPTQGRSASAAAIVAAPRAPSSTTSEIKPAPKPSSSSQNEPRAREGSIQEDVFRTRR